MRTVVVLLIGYIRSHENNKTWLTVYYDHFSDKFPTHLD